MKYQSSNPVFVFSHPNHELAVMGMVQGWQPSRIIYLTDGGGSRRVSQTIEGLTRIGQVDKAVFLDHSEDEFYARLLAKDSTYFVSVAEQVKGILQAVEPTTIYADAIEFYNPVHDIVTPIVHAALRDLPDVTHFEIPLVAQTSRDNFLIQRLPDNGRKQQIEYRLQPEELDTKCQARDEIYTMLADQFGSTLRKLSREHLGHEFARLAPESGVSEPGGNYVLRYEWRARKLLEEGKIDDMISFRDHYLPVADSLVGSD